MSDTQTWDSVFDGEPLEGAGAPGERRVRRRKRRKHREKRRDIQGLRMVAVVAVVINHLTGHPQGGFVGVDVFFVISGFLITGHLLREHGKNGTISLLDFYKRRIRRLFPAALTVTAGTILAAYFVFSAQRFKNTVTDAIWATLFGANWRFINVGTDYFQAAGPVSPLQHYWSLSVEEQFYVVWPVVILTALLLVAPLAAKRLSARSAAAFLAGALLTGASLVIAVLQSTSDPVVAYFSTFTRGWELGLGALLAVLAQTDGVRRLSNRTVTTTMSWFGLAMIAASLFITTPNHFPFPGALLPCLGSAVVIMAWSERAPARNLLLTSRLSNYLGDISYSIYVVHFPVIIIAGALIDERTTASDSAILLLVLSLSMVLFHLIEDPIRQSNWLKPQRERGAYVTSSKLSGQKVLIGLASGVCGLATFVLLPAPGNGSYNDIIAALQAPTPTAAAPSTGAAGNPLAAVTIKDTAGAQVKVQAHKIKSALLAQSWPSLSPPLGAEVPSLTRGCGLTLTAPGPCTWGDLAAKKVIYLVGDSTSEAYTLAFASMVSAVPDWRVRAAGGSGCPFADRVLKDGPHTPGCGARNDQLLAEIKRVRPDIVVSTSGVGNLAGSNSQSILAQLEKIKSSVGKIVMLPPNPILPDPNSCYTKFSQPQDCVGRIDSDYQAWLTRNAGMAATLHGMFIDPTDWYCVDGLCPAFVGSVPMRRDGIHITGAFAKTLGPLVLESFQQGKLLN
jgi:peptidoglycan/LPS O-acetylase OafA/YrhL